MKTTNIVIDENDYKQFKKFAIEQNKSVSKLIREYISEQIKKLNKKQKGE